MSRSHTWDTHNDTRLPPNQYDLSIQRFNIIKQTTLAHWQSPGIKGGNQLTKLLKLMAYLETDS